MIRIIFFKLFLPVFLFSSGCSNKQMRNFNAVPTFSGDYVNAVIEIPAGTNKRIKYNEHERMFLVEQADGADRVIDFLPYPGNYGFVPGTYMDPVMGGDGNPVEILVISESVPTGTVIEVIPVLVLYFNDTQEFGGQLINPKIIAVPEDRKQRVIEAADYVDLYENYPDLVDILIQWFVSYKGTGENELKAMGDSDVAINEIEKWETRRF
ncbi:MAG: inorganic diphosphatase [Bacteroidales bacterium]